MRRKFIALPNEDNFHLTPKLWMAVGLIAYNYHLLTLQPLQILSAAHNARHIPPARVEAATKGLAVMLSAEGLTPATRTALSEIARTLLTPFGLSISQHGGSPLPGAGRTARYLLIADVTSSDELATPLLLQMPESKRAIV